MYGYYFAGTAYGLWATADEARAHAHQYGRYSYTPLKIDIVNDPRAPVAARRRLSADAEFLALGQ